MKEENKTIRVFSGSELEVNLLQEELLQIGISGIVQNKTNSGLVAGFAGGLNSAVDFYIRTTDLQKAEPILSEFARRNNSA